jgi:hypothetical protein
MRVSKRTKDLGWNLFGIVTFAWIVWIEILIQIEFAKARAISRDIQEIHDRIEVQLHGHED